MGELNAETRKTITRANVQEVVVGGVGGSIISSLLFPFPLLTLPAKVEQFTVKRANGRTKKNEQKFNSRRSATTPTSPHLLHVPFTMRHMKQFIIYIFIAVVILHRRLLFTSSYSSCKTVELWKIYECNYPIWTYIISRGRMNFSRRTFNHKMRKKWNKASLLLKSISHRLLAVC